MWWSRFLIFNAAGGLVLAIIYGYAAWCRGKALSRIAEPAGIILGILGVIALGGSVLFFRYHEARLQAEAERAFPGPIATGRRRS